MARFKWDGRYRSCPEAVERAVRDAGFGGLARGLPGDLFVPGYGLFAREFVVVHCGAVEDVQVLSLYDSCPIDGTRSVRFLLRVASRCKAGSRDLGTRPLVPETPSMDHARLLGTAR